MATTTGPAREGQVLTRNWKSGRGYALRFRAYGQRRYLTLGSEHDGWTARKAATELQNILADVRRGTWTPPDRNRPTERDLPDTADAGPTFHEFASKRLAGRRGEVSERTVEFEEWALTLHLLPYFANWLVADIDIEAVDEYRQHKVRQAAERTAAIERGNPLRDRNGRALRPLAPQTINRTIDVLRSILALAVEYRHLPTNPAAGRRRRLKAKAKRPVHLDNVHQIQALLDAAQQLDNDPSWIMSDRRANVATLVLAGPRASEHAHLRWRDVDLANGRIMVGRSKTDAGLREIHLYRLLARILTHHKATSPRTGLDDLVFPTSTGKPRDAANLRNRVLAPVLKLADQLLMERGQSPLPVGVTPHKLRHTFASILVACGDDPTSVMAQLGHADPKFTLKVYAHLMRRDPGERAQLKAFVQDDNSHQQPAGNPPATALALVTA